MKVRNKIIMTFAGFALFTSSALALQGVSSGHTSIINKQASEASKVTTTPIKANLANIGSIQYNNTFANNYATSLTMGINRTTDNWTNYLINGDASYVQLYQYVSDTDTNRAITSDKDVSKDWYKKPTDAEMKNYYNSAFMVKRSFNDPSKELTGTTQLTSSKQVSSGEFFRYYGHDIYDASSNTWTTVSSTSDGEISKATYGANESVSVGIRLSQKNANVLSDIKFNPDGGNTDSGTRLANMNGISYVDTVNSNYKVYTGCYTFANQSFGRSDDGSEVYSGTTAALDPTTMTLLGEIKKDPKDAKLTATQYLNKHQADIEAKIKISLTNGYPGSVYDAITFSADDSAGTISASYLPKAVLVNGVVMPYTGSPINLQVMSGVIPSTGDGSESVGFYQENTTDKAVAISLSICIPGIVLVTLLAIAIAIYQRQRAKYTPFEYEL